MASIPPPRRRRPGGKEDRDASCPRGAFYDRFGFSLSPLNAQIVDNRASEHPILTSRAENHRAHSCEPECVKESLERRKTLGEHHIFSGVAFEQECTIAGAFLLSRGLREWNLRLPCHHVYWQNRQYLRGQQKS